MVSIPRFNIAGVRDYTGVSLEEIIADIRFVLTKTKDLTSCIRNLEKEVESNHAKLDDPDGILGVIQYHISLFDDYSRDLLRLSEELPNGVEARHLTIIENLRQNAAHNWDGMIKAFKKDHIIGTLKDEGLRPLLDEIYSSIRQHLLDVRLLCALKDQLATYISLIPVRESTAEQANKTVKAPNRNMVEPLNIPSGTEWKDISIRFINSEEIYISIGRTSFGVQNFQRCGFADLRNKLPNEQWNILASFAKNHGELTVREYEKAKGRGTKNFKKHISLLRAKLKSLFNITGDPITAYSKKTKSWKVNFTLNDRAALYPEDDEL